MKSPDEEYCKLQYDLYLHKIGLDINRKWREVPQSEEPPDYQLFYNGKIFAVEVMSMVEIINSGTFQITTKGVNKFWSNFINRINSEAKKLNILSGAYTVKVSGIIENFHLYENEVRERIYKYIETTQSVEQAQEIVIYKNRRQSIKINKTHNSKDVIYIFPPVRAKWGGESDSDLRQLIENAASTKEYKLRNESLPKILLLLDKYSFADREDYLNCQPNISIPPFFEEIFIITQFGNYLIRPGKFCLVYP